MKTYTVVVTYTTTHKRMVEVEAEGAIHAQAIAREEAEKALPFKMGLVVKREVAGTEVQ